MHTGMVLSISQDFKKLRFIAGIKSLDNVILTGPVGPRPRDRTGYGGATRYASSFSAKTKDDAWNSSSILSVLLARPCWWEYRQSASIAFLFGLIP